MGKRVSAVTGSMSLYSTRPNVRLGTSKSLLKDYRLNRSVLVTNYPLSSVNNYTINKSTGLLKNGFVNKVGNYQTLVIDSIKILKLN